MYKTVRIKLTKYQRLALLDFTNKRYKTILKEPFISKGIESGRFFTELIHELEKEKTIYNFKKRDLHWLLEKSYFISKNQLVNHIQTGKIQHLGRFYSMSQLVEKIKLKQLNYVTA